MSDTPRTDAAAFRFTPAMIRLVANLNEDSEELISADFARTLERELAAMTERVYFRLSEDGDQGETWEDKYSEAVMNLARYDEVMQKAVRVNRHMEEQLALAQRQISAQSTSILEMMQINAEMQNRALSAEAQIKSASAPVPPAP